MLNYNVKFLTCDDTIHIKNGDFKSYTYETKKKVEESVYDSGKRSFCERRSGHWRAPRPRQIRQLDAKLRDRSLIVCEWTTDTLITLVFSSGAIAYLTIKPDTLDVIQILFDRYCVSKLSGQTVTGAIVCQSHLMFCHDRLATLITYGKNANTRPCRISERDPHIQTIELGGARRSDRKISSCNIKNGLKLLVWSTSTVEPAPWSPVVEDHANLHMYRINGQHMTLVAYHQLENETLSAELSHKCDCTVHIVEQITCHKSGVNLNWICYNVPNSDEQVTKLSPLRESETQVSLPAPARTVRRSPCDVKILAACIDGSLHVVHNAVGVTHSVRAGFIATEVRWAGELIVAAEEGGRMQCFDRALSLLHHHTKCFDMASYLRDAKRMQILTARQARSGPLILLSFSGGPLALLHIAHPRLLTSWLRAGRASHAVALLRALSWDEDGMECLWAVNKLVCYAFRSGTDALSAESTAQAALGAYFSAAAPPAAAQRFAPPLTDLARKLFHHLLRRGRIEKALSLAVDVRAWDLFADARWAASRRNLAALAGEAAALAHHYARAEAADSDCSDSCSQCSSHSCSGDTSVSEIKPQTKPPPLPRLTLPTLKPIPTVPTNSIRPNLHQYLERDNTIWTTNVDDTYVKISGHDRIKPILTQNGKWGLDTLHQRLGTSVPTLAVIDESPSKPTSTLIDVVPRIQDDKVASAQFRSLYHTELREEQTSNLYRYHSNNFNPSSLTDRGFKFESVADRNRSTERNKVKFSDTVTVAVVSEPPTCPESARELADSLPLSPPHKYLAAFAPHPRPAPPLAPPPPLAPQPPLAAPPPAANAAQRPPKIKVVHFGMV